MHEPMAQIPEREFKSKVCRTIKIRCAREADAADIFNLAKNVALEADFQVTEADEFKMTLAEERTWIRKFLEGPHDLILVAELDGRIVGMIDFQSNSKRRRLRHAGAFGMSVRKYFRDQGLGRALIATLLEWAKADPVVEKVSLTVLATNERAIHLYKSLGFLEEGRRIQEVRVAADRYIDGIMMYQMVRGS